MMPIHGYGSINKLERDLAHRPRRSRWERLRCRLTFHFGTPYYEADDPRRLWSCCGRRCWS